tara:strand:- start:442 stop:618 length:177 start_codon:yes stop_codon:yes gene_type:complete
MTATVNVCDDDGVIFATINEIPVPLDILRGLVENNGRAWLVFGDGTNLVVTPHTDEEQ